MPTNVKLIDPADSQPSVTTSVSVYTSPTTGLGTRITQFVASIPSLTTANYAIFVGTEADNSRLVAARIDVVGPGNDSPIEPINVFMNPGDEIFLKVSAASQIIFYASGVEF